MQKLKLKPHQIKPNNESWFYEDRKGIHIYHNGTTKSVGIITKRKLLGVLSRIYQIDFAKIVQAKKSK